MRTDKINLDKPTTGVGELPTSPPHGLKGSLQADPIVSPNAIISIGIFGLLCVVLFIVANHFFNRFKQAKKRTSSTTVMPTLDAKVLLLRQLDLVSLPQENHINENDRLTDWARFSSTASVILRRAVEFHTKLPVAERTTHEIHGMFGANDRLLALDIKAEIFELLTTLDDITFAGKAGTVSHASLLLAKVRAVVKDLTVDGLEKDDRGSSAGSEVKIFE
jgi:hypothetical protein